MLKDIVSSMSLLMEGGFLRAQITAVRELKKFLGFSNFYQWFFRGFSTIAVTLTLLLKDMYTCSGPNSVEHQQANAVCHMVFHLPEDQGLL